MKKATVIHRTKHDKTPRCEAGEWLEHPAMQKLAGMIESGEISHPRTMAYLTDCTQQISRQTPGCVGGGGVCARAKPPDEEMGLHRTKILANGGLG